MAISRSEVLEYIESANMLEISELIKDIEEKFGVTAAAPMAMVAAPAAGGGEAAAEEEKTDFDVILTSFGEKKIQVIKVIREITGLDLKGAKDLVDNVPKPVKEGVQKDEAEDMKKKIEEAGGTIELK